MKIRDVVLNSNILLAPMAGVSDVGFRKLAAYYKAGLTYTEMVSVKALNYGSLTTKNLLLVSETEKKCAVQLFGNNPADFLKAIHNPLLSKFDIIDINMGCPAPKIIKNNEGAALMLDSDLSYRIINTCVQNSNKPITVKFRKGFDDTHINAISFAKVCESAGASAITIHGRTKMQMYSGKVDLDIIQQVKKAVNIPVIGNGDIVDRESLDQMFNTGVDGCMIGRGALGRPWIFKTFQDSNFVPNIPDIVKQHIDELKKYYNEKWIVLNMRKHFLWYLKNIHSSSEVKKKIITENSLLKAFDIFEKAFLN